MVSDLVADPIHTVGLALCRFVLICLVCFDFVLHCSNPRSCSLLQPAFAGCCSISINFCTYYTIFQSVQVASIQYTQHTPSYSMYCSLVHSLFGVLDGSIWFLPGDPHCLSSICPFAIPRTEFRLAECDR